MAEDMVTVPADAVHAVLGVFARISHLASSDAIRALRDALPEQDRMRAQLFAFAAERDRAVRELKRRADRAVPGVERDTWMAAAAVVAGTQESGYEKEAGTP